MWKLIMASGWGLLSSLMVFSALADTLLLVSSAFGMATYWFLACFSFTSRGNLSDAQVRVFLIAGAVTLLAVTAAMFPYPLFIFMPLFFGPPLLLIAVSRPR